MGLAEGALEAALKRHGMEYVVSPGEGTFYAPKIDLHMTDVLGRSWQMGTIQVDYHMPRQFGLTYMGADNREHSPVVIHRALLGSLERFIGILIEHYGGAFPFWLAPVQVRLIPVGADHRDDADALAGELRELGYRVDTDDRDETVGKRIRDAELEKVPKVLVYGDQGVPRLARGPRPRRRAGHEELRGARRGACYSELLTKAGADPFLTRRAEAPARVQPRISGESRAAACSGFRR